MEETIPSEVVLHFCRSKLFTLQKCFSSVLNELFFSYTFFSLWCSVKYTDKFLYKFFFYSRRHHFACYMHRFLCWEMLMVHVLNNTLLLTFNYLCIIKWNKKHSYGKMYCQPDSRARVQKRLWKIINAITVYNFLSRLQKKKKNSI